MLLAFALAPLLVTLDTWDGWKTLATERGWQVLSFSQDACTDAGVKSLEAQIRQRADSDPSRVYLAGRGDNAPCVFFGASRLPDLWAAAVAVGGDPRRAIETNRLFGANLSMLPILWVAGSDPNRRNISGAVIPGAVMREQAALKEVGDFLAARPLDPWPLKLDYETGNRNFVRCHWLEIVKADAGRRNDALPVTRIVPGSGAKLLPGPIRPADQILAINGKDPAQFLAEAKEERNVTVMVQRGKDKVRLETKVVLPQREEGLTIRMQAEVQPETKEILIITRGVVQLKINLPPRWTPGSVNWNGMPAITLGAPGCHVLTDAGGTVTAGPCL